jgi:hypothetical protein
MKNSKRGGWKGRKVNGGRANVVDTRVKPPRPRQVWVKEEGEEYYEPMKLIGLHMS